MKLHAQACTSLVVGRWSCFPCRHALPPCLSPFMLPTCMVCIFPSLYFPPLSARPHPGDLATLPAAVHAMSSCWDPWFVQGCSGAERPWARACGGHWGRSWTPMTHLWPLFLIHGLWGTVLDAPGERRTRRREPSGHYRGQQALDRWAVAIIIHLLFFSLWWPHPVAWGQSLPMGASPAEGGTLAQGPLWASAGPGIRNLFTLLCLSNNEHIIGCAWKWKLKL